MKNTRLIGLLSTFSVAEIKEFDKFISSPYFGCRKFIVDFFKLLKNYHPDFEEEKIKKEILFAKLYKGRKYNDGLMRRMSSGIVKIALEYLSIKKFKEVDAFRNNCLMSELRNRKLDNFFESKSQLATGNFENSRTKDYYALLDKFMTDIEIYNYKSIMNKPDMFVQLEESIESLINLMAYSLFNIMDKVILINYEFKRDVTKKFEEMQITENLMKLSGINTQNSHIIFSASHFAYNIIKDKSDIESYKKLKNILNEKKEYFTKSQLRTFYSYIFYFYNYYTSRNSEKYFKDEFELYNLILDEELFLNYTPYMSIFFCRNYIISCKRVGRIEAINKFAEGFSKYFLPENKESIVNYAKASAMLGENHFNKSLEFSAKVNIDVPQFKSDVKILRLKCYYELNYEDSLISEMDSLRHFYHNLKEDNPRLQNIGSMISLGKNFLRHFNSFLKLKDNFSESKKIQLVREIESENLLNEKKWLLKKITQLRKK